MDGTTLAIVVDIMREYEQPLDIEYRPGLGYVKLVVFEEVSTELMVALTKRTGCDCSLGPVNGESTELTLRDGKRHNKMSLVQDTTT